MARRLVYEVEPLSEWMMDTALLSLVVNLTVLRLLFPKRSSEVHLGGTWLVTRADVVANLGGIVVGLLVLWFGTPYPDFVIGALIGLYGSREAIEILGDARSTARDATCG